MSRWLRVALQVLVATGALATTALGHANYVKSVPEADGRVARPPTEVRISFSEAPEPKLSEIAVLDVDGRRVDRGDLAVADATTLKETLAPIGEGGYTVTWKTTSAVDGHETRGAFAFAVGSAPLPAPPDIPTAPPPNPLEILARVLTYAGVALLTGAPLFARLIARGAGDRRVPLVAHAGAASAVVGSALFLTQIGGLPIIAGSRLGVLVLGRAALAAAGAFLPWPAALAGLGAAAAATLTLQSHAAAADDPVGLALDYLHLLAASVWVGGLAALAAVDLPRRVLRGRADARELGDLVWRFSQLGLVAVAVIVATGTLQSLRRLLDPRDLVETPYGLALLAKIVLLGVAVGLASLNLLRHGPALRAGGRDPARTKRLLDLGVRGEVAVVAAILVAAAALTALSPPNYATGAAFVGVQHAGGLRLQLLVQSPNPGLNRFDVRLQDGLNPPANVARVTLRFTMKEMDMGEQELEAQPRGAGQYVATGSPASMIGHWNVLVIVRRTGLEDTRALFTVPIPGGPGGPQTRIVPAGGLSLFVSTEPATPVAGQPLTIVLVAADQAGAAVADARVRAELDGASYDAVAGPGLQYRIAIPPLSAGPKRVVLVVRTAEGESRGTYDVTVAP